MEANLKLIVTGSSGFNDQILLFSSLDKILDKIKYVVSGASSAVDEMVTEWCRVRGVPQIFFYPKIKNMDGSTDKGAVIKNKIKMIKISNGALIFSNGSEGTNQFIEMCKSNNLYHKVVNV